MIVVITEKNAIKTVLYFVIATSSGTYVGHSFFFLYTNKVDKTSVIEATSPMKQVWFCTFAASTHALTLRF